jgi:hypothetical protein
VNVDLVLVDGPNLMSSVINHLLGELPNKDEQIKGYLAEWFDLDRFVNWTLRPQFPPALGTVAFHSRRALGPKRLRLNDREADCFWTRQAGNPHTSAFLVDVPGDQRETYEHTCEHCGKSNTAPSRGEKGVDNAMTVYMFESFERWDSLCIFSRDVDFVPAVWALRRRGKKVFVAAPEEDARTGLGRASQSLFGLAFHQLDADFQAFLLARKDGVLDQLIAELVAAGVPPSKLGFLQDRANVSVAALANTLPEGVFYSKGEELMRRMGYDGPCSRFDPGPHVGFRFPCDKLRPVDRASNPPVWAERRIKDLRAIGVD